MKDWEEKVMRWKLDIEMREAVDFIARSTGRPGELFWFFELAAALGVDF